MLHKLYCHNGRLFLQQLWKNIRTVQKIALILASLQTTHPCMTRRHSFFSTSLAHPRTNVLQTTAPKATLPRTKDSSQSDPSSNEWQLPKRLFLERTTAHSRDQSTNDHSSSFLFLTNNHFLKPLFLDATSFLNYRKIPNLNTFIIA